MTLRRSLWVTLLFAVGTAHAQGLQKAPLPDPLTWNPFGPAAVSGGKTQCKTCHTTGGWQGAAFPHERTGFPLVGEHAHVDCRACHVKSLEDPLPRQCSSCHRDPHRTQFGQRCEGCHTELNWKARFDADAHRMTNFPLVGRHALIPCTECHQTRRDRTFTRATVPCLSCHETDYARASVNVNHQALGFGTDCRQCHGAFRFTPARFPAHESCFPLRGSHAGIPCLTCHSTLTGVTTTGQCATGTAACTACHTHTCDRTDPLHKDVAGYQCRDQKCGECHQQTGKP